MGNERFALDPSVVKSEVLKSTGQKPGKVSVEGKEVEVTGSTVTSYWANKSGAPATSYRFAIGGSDADYQNAWSSIVGVYQLHPAPAVQVVVLAIAVTQVLHDLLLQGRDDNSLNEVANQWIATFFFSCYNKGMNQYQKKIVNGKIYSLLSGLIWESVEF